MLDIGWSELLLIAVVALVVIGPKELPRVLYKAGQALGKARGMARHVRSGFDTMVREAELEEMQKTWAKQNAAVMAAHPATGETYGEDDARRPPPQPGSPCGLPHGVEREVSAQPTEGASAWPVPDEAPFDPLRGPPPPAGEDDAGMRGRPA